MRKRLHVFLKSKVGEALLAVLVGANFIIIIIESDSLHAKAQLAEQEWSWIQSANTTFLVIFILELGVRIFTYQKWFFRSGWNWMDLTIILADVGTTILATQVEFSASLSSLRIIGLLRLLRSVKIMQMSPQLALMVKGLLASIEVLIWGCGMLILITMTFGVFAVQIIHPINLRVADTGYYDDVDCERCPRAFQSVLNSVITFSQQIIAGDSWGMVSIPVMEEAPVTGIFFATVFITIQLMLLNLILSVIVDTALRVSQEDKQELLKAKEKNFLQHAKVLKTMCADMDLDGDGNLTKEEILKGYEHNEEFRNLLTLMDVQRDEIEDVFGILDRDESGELNYDEFIKELHRMRSQATQTMLAFIRFNVAQVKSQVGHMQVAVRETRTYCQELGRPPPQQPAEAIHDRFREQLHEELRELQARTSTQHDQLLQNLRDLLQGPVSSRWRFGVVEAMGQQSGRNGAGDISGATTPLVKRAAGAADTFEGQSASPARCKQAARALAESRCTTPLPCCQVKTGQKGKQCIGALRPASDSDPGELSPSPGCLAKCS